MGNDLFNFKLIIIFTCKYRLRGSTNRALMVLQLANMQHRMNPQRGRKIEAHSNRVDSFKNTVGAYPLACQLSSQVPRQLKVISLQPNVVPSLEYHVTTMAIGIASHLLRSGLEMLLNLVVNLGTSSNKFLHILNGHILQL